MRRSPALLAIVGVLGVLLLAAGASGCGPPAPEHATSSVARLTVAAAADLQFALDDMLGAFRSAHPSITVHVTYGSSGNFDAQLRNGAPFDLYLSADVDYPRRLAADGLALDDDVFAYAVGRIVLWVPNASPLDVERRGVDILSDPAVQKLAVANPQHAPYGRAAIAALRSLGVWETAEPRLVFGENIAQTAQFVESGAADVGVIALSLAIAPVMKPKGRYGEIPMSAYPTMEQGGMILRSTRHPDAARALRRFLLGDAGRALLERYGFFLPAK